MEELRNYLLALHASRCEFFQREEAEREVAVGIIDSIYDPGDFKEYNRFGRSFDVIDANVGATNGHGYQVLTILSFLTQEPEYHLFQAVDEDGNCRDSHLMKAIGLATEFNEVDVLNLSVGSDHVSNPDKGCTVARSECSLCEVAEESVYQGISIVAGAGNQPHAESICCPSLSNYTISVGGAVTICTAKTETGGLNRGSDIARPPNAYWVYRDDDAGSDTIYCSNRGCLPGESCQNNRLSKPWDCNVEFSSRKPDILAPVALIWKDESGNPLLLEGTSYSTPIVTAGIVCSLEWAREGGGNISAKEIRQGIRESGFEIEDTEHHHFSTESFVNKIREYQNLPPMEFTDKEPFIPSYPGSEHPQ